MRRILPFILTSLIALSLTGSDLMAQKRIIVTGTITDKVEDNKPLTDVAIYAYRSVSEAEEALNSYMQAIETGGFFDPGLVVQSYPDANGHYKISARKDGALLFDFMGRCKPVVVEVNSQTVIDLAVDTSITLDNSTITAETDKLP